MVREKEKSVYIKHQPLGDGWNKWSREPREALVGGSVSCAAASLSTLLDELHTSWGQACGFLQRMLKLQIPGPCGQGSSWCLAGGSLDDGYSMV